MKKSNKKGFTIVELVIVIAVIAILAAVLIPTFSSIIKKANISADTQLVRNLNTALAEDKAINGEHKTMQSALDAAVEGGYIVERINAKATGNEILWDSVADAFCYLNDGKVEYTPDVTGTKAGANEYKLWKIDSKPSDKFSTYLYGATEDKFENVKTGLDVGNENVTSISYVCSDPDQDVVIRTNSYTTNLTVNTKGSVTHYGNVGTIDIQEVAMSSFHLYGKARIVKLAKGNLEVERGAVVTLVTVTASTENTAKVKVDGNVTTYVANQTAVPMSGANQPEAVTLEQGSVEISNAVAIVNGTAVSTFPESFSEGTMILLADNTNEMNITGGIIIGNFTKLKAKVSGNGTIVFKDIYTTNFKDDGFTGTLTFDGGVLDNGGRGTKDEEAAVYVNSNCDVTFKNMTIAASLTKGIKASNVKSISIDNCEFDATNLTIAKTGSNSALQSLSLVDIQCTTNNVTKIAISNSLFKGAPQGATNVPSIVDSSCSLADSDTGAAIKIKAEKGNNLGTVSITGNRFVDNYRDIVVGTAAYADKFTSTSASDRCPEMLCNNNKIEGWTISGNSTTLTSAVIDSRAVATLSHSAKTFGEEKYDKYTTDAAKCGKLTGGVAIWVISDCYTKTGDTWSYVKDGTTYSITHNEDGSVTLN